MEVRALTHRLQVNPTATQTPLKAAAVAVLARLQPGQTLIAQLIDQPAPNLARLKIDQVEVLAKTTQSLPDSKQLRLLVEKNEDFPVFKLLKSMAPESAETTLLRHNLPKQLPLKDILQGVLRLLNPPPENAPNGKTSQTALAKPASFLSVAQNLLDSLKTDTPLQPEQKMALEQIAKNQLPINGLDSQKLRQAVLDSGIFFEPKLLATLPADFKDDLKLAFFRLFFAGKAEKKSSSAHKTASEASNGKTDAQHLQKPALQKLAEAALARIETQQVASLPKDDSGLKQLWQLEIPVIAPNQGSENVQLRIEHDQEATNENNSAKAHWSICLKLDFAQTGLIEARIGLVGESSISGTFWSEREDTKRLIAAHLPKLETALVNAGLKINQLAALHGKAPEPILDPLASETLVDEVA